MPTPVADFITAVREQSLHGTPNWLYRQVTLVWNEAARDAASGAPIPDRALFPRSTQTDR